MIYKFNLYLNDELKNKKDGNDTYLGVIGTVNVNSPQLGAETDA